MATKYKDSGSSIRNEKLGMRNYKDSGIPWIGMIPSDWEVCRLKFLHNNSNVGESIDKEYCSDNQKDTTFYTAGLKPIHTTYNNFPNWKYTQKEDLLLARNGTPYVYNPLINSVYSDHIIRIDIKNDFDKTFIKYCLQQAISSVVVDAVSIATWSISLWDKQIIPIPPLPTQQCIADFLDRKCAEIDELTALQETMIDELKRYKQSLITETVTKGLDPNAPMKDSGVDWIGEIPEGWVVLPFKQMYKLGKGLSITKADLVENGVPVISYGQIHSKSNTGTTIKDELIRYVPTLFLENSKDALVKLGDVIFADTSEDLEGCGNCIYVDRGMTLFAGYHTIIASNRNSSSTRYLPYLFKTDCWRTQIRAVVNGVKLFSVPQKTLAATSIILPSHRAATDCRLP